VDLGDVSDERAGFTVTMGDGAAPGLLRVSLDASATIPLEEDSGMLDEGTGCNSHGFFRTLAASIST